MTRAERRTRDPQRDMGSGGTDFSLVPGPHLSANTWYLQDRGERTGVKATDTVRRLTRLLDEALRDELRGGANAADGEEDAVVAEGFSRPRGENHIRLRRLTRLLDETLRDELRGGADAADGEEDVVVEEGGGQALDLLGKRRREHQRLAVARARHVLLWASG